MKTTRHGFKAIVFDAFGTVVTPVSRFGPYQRLAREAAIDALAFREVAMKENVSIGDLARRFGRPDLVDDLERELAADVATVRAFDDVGPLRHALERDGIPYAICSNLGAGYGDRVKGLVPGAAAYVYSYEVRAAKPEAAIYARVVEALGVEPADILFIGDTPRADVEGPRAFGMSAILVARRRGDTLVSVMAKALPLAAGPSIVP